MVGTGLAPPREVGEGGIGKTCTRELRRGVIAHVLYVCKPFYLLPCLQGSLRIDKNEKLWKNNY